MARVMIALMASLMAVATMAQDAGPLVGEWELVTERAQWGPRDTAEPFVFDGKLWISNGYYHGGVLYPDLWSSETGRNWRMVIEKTPYPAYSEMVVYDGKVWAIKGEVWNSPDGESWEQVLAETPFGTRGYGEAVVHDGRIFQLGSGADVYATTDGVTWERVCAEAPYGARAGSAVASYAGRLWLMGGRVGTPNDPPEEGYEQWTTFNDVWCSEDGATWERVLEHAPWAERTWFVAEVYRDRLWIIGGYDNVNHANFGDVWYTDDGVTWHQMPAPEEFKSRHEATPWVYDDSLWIAGGNTWPVLNDVWRLTVPRE
ncbi:MAG: hypothetical protein ACOX9R_10975 [Armatimonadota bacterium]|jgi:hypothetical protein